MGGKKIAQYEKEQSEMKELVNECLNQPKIENEKTH